MSGMGGKHWEWNWNWSRKKRPSRTVRRPGLALAVVAVVVAGDDGRVDVGLVRHGFAEAVAGENHCGGFGVVCGVVVSRSCERMEL